MIEGVPISLGGQEYTVPALNFKSLREHEADIEMIAGDPGETAKAFSKERADAVCRVVHAALKRNYPDVTIEQVSDWLDFRNMAGVIAAILGQSGLTASKAPAGEAEPGEAVAP